MIAAEIERAFSRGATPYSLTPTNFSHAIFNLEKLAEPPSPWTPFTPFSKFNGGNLSRAGFKRELPGTNYLCR